MHKKIDIVLGSASKDKMSILINAISNRIMYRKIDGISVEPNIPDQPLTFKQTEEGAKNRAKNAYHNGDYDLAFGMEGGLVMVANVYSLVGIVAIYDGAKYFIGVSEKIALPREVSESIKSGKQFGEVIRNFKKKLKNHSNKELDRTNELISREKTFTVAITRALDNFFKASLSY